MAELRKGPLVSLLILLLWGATGPHFMISLDKEAYAQEERPELTVRNIGLMPIELGRGYLLYRWDNGSWVRVRTGLIFTDDLIVLTPFRSWKQRITLKYLPEKESIGDPRFYPDLPPGRYKVVKEICGWPRGCVNASMEFEIAD
ncbi:immunoglobulin-like domain-containing protein [Thermococcus sp. GR7]|uniref:immunoglobulin-like domain-containing protein n=1 Tax=Thermococcus sp. GR7 TaxID=1638257 RepID=UPI00351AE34E